MEAIPINRFTGEVIEANQSAKATESDITNLFDAANGAINERIAYELPKIIDNLRDPNTDPTKARTLTVKVTFKGDVSRTVFTTDAQVTSKLAATDGVPIMFTLIGNDQNATLLEITKENPGQSYMFGNEQSEPKPIKTIR